MEIVITDHRFPHVEQERRAVEAAGGNLVVGQVTEEDKLIALCRNADGILVVRAPVTKRVIEGMTRCRIIVRYGIGIDNVDVRAASERGIMVANVPDYCIDEVSDHALTLLLMLSRQAVPAIALAKERQWSVAKLPSLHRLRGQVCGLFGAGRIGGLLAAKVAALGMKAIVYDPYLDDERARQMGIAKASFDELLSSSDFISIHAPLDEKTHHIFREETFAKMKSTAYIVNTARGGLIDEAALISAIDAGVLAGAALDVLECETSVTELRSAIVQHPKIIVTAHTAWVSEEARATLQARAISQVLDALGGKQPYGLVNGKDLTRSPL